MCLSFSTAKDLRNQAEMLPTGPKWKYESIAPMYPTKGKITLYYRNPIQCLQSLVHSSLLKDYIELRPMQLFESPKKIMRIYTEWLSLYTTSGIYC